jgi:hypothetical protein
MNQNEVMGILTRMAPGSSGSGPPSTARLALSSARLFQSRSFSMGNRMGSLSTSLAQT